MSPTRLQGVSQSFFLATCNRGRVAMPKAPITWNQGDQQRYFAALKRVQSGLTGKKLVATVINPARNYTRKAIVKTKIGRKATTTEAWWDGATGRYANYIPKGAAFKRTGTTSKLFLAVGSRGAKRRNIGGRGFARQTWYPIAHRLGVTIRGTDDWGTVEKDQGRRKVVAGKRSTRQRGRYADYHVRDTGDNPSAILVNHSDAVVNQDQGSKGLPPRNIHAAGMRAAEKVLDAQLRKMGEQMERTWAR